MRGRCARCSEQLRFGLNCARLAEQDSGCVQVGLVAVRDRIEIILMLV